MKVKITKVYADISTTELNFPKLKVHYGHQAILSFFNLSHI